MQSCISTTSYIPTVFNSFFSFDELSDRFELPNARNRWERPLITLNDEEKTPVEDIYNILFENTVLPNKNIATEYVHTLFTHCVPLNNTFNRKSWRNRISSLRWIKELNQ